MDWRVTVILELDRSLGSDELEHLAGRPARTVLPVRTRATRGVPAISVSANEVAVEPTDAVDAAVREMQAELGHLAGEPEIVRVRNYLVAGFGAHEAAAHHEAA
jgi:hypothetical protein